MDSVQSLPEELRTDLSPTVTLVGASTRAMAWSASKAGERPFCLDLFNDTDLLEIPGVTAQKLAHWPPLELGGLLPPGIPWAYTGGLENYPGLLKRLAVHAPLWGVVGRGLRLARQPRWWGELLKNHGVAVPPCAIRPPTGEESAWLLKPYRGAGGRGVQPWPADVRVNPLRFFAQKRVPGLCASAVFAVSPQDVECLGVTEQWVGQPWLFGTGFGYCGSIGPMHLTVAQGAQINAIGQALVGMDLRGIVGVDLMLDGETVWVIEINPRWPASVEVLERSLSFSAWRWHRWGCGVDARKPDPVAPNGKVGAKAILFAPADLEFPARWPKDQECWADLPTAGEKIPAGSPVLTSLAFAASDGLCRRLIVKRVHLALRLLGQSGVGD